jgi:hypothetical protein
LGGKIEPGETPELFASGITGRGRPVAEVRDLFTVSQHAEKTMQKNDLAEKLALFNDHWNPGSG